MITEVLMKPGTWEVKLLDSTRNAVRQLPQYHGHVVITPLRLDDGNPDRAGLISKALYMGIVRRRSKDMLHFGGPHILAYLGDEQGYKSNASQSLWANGTPWANVMNWMWTHCHGATVEPNKIEQGTYYQNPVNSATEVLSATDNQMPREIIDNLGPFWGGIEYRVRTSTDGLHAYCDFGSTGVNGLFRKGNPQVVLLRDTGGREAGDQGAGTPRINGMQLVTFDFAGDQDSYSNSLGLSLANPAFGTLWTTYFTVPSWDGVAHASWGRRRSIPTNDNNMVNAYGTAYRLTEEVERVAGTAVVNEYAPTRLITPGDEVYIYDPANNLIETNGATPPIYFRGDEVHALTFRCTQISWPLLEGMGVYFISSDLNNTVVDLTDYVDWETGANSSLLLGTPPRPLSPGLAALSNVT